MRYIVDTHILLWLAHGNDAAISKSLLTRLKESPFPKVVSIASLWEMSIKKSIGKLSFDNSLFSEMEKRGYEILPVHIPHLHMLMTLPQHHNDPFDRILIAQARYENLTIVTSDRQFERYDAKIILA